MEPVKVQALATTAAVETLNESALHRLAGRDKRQADTSKLWEVEYRAACALLAVVDSDFLRQAEVPSEFVEIGLIGPPFLEGQMRLRIGREGKRAASWRQSNIYSLSRRSCEEIISSNLIAI